MKRLVPVVAALAAVTLSGCSVRGLQSYHLPGGATSGQSTYTVKACFLDVTALQVQASVRVGDVPVGDIENIDVVRLGKPDCPSPDYPTPDGKYGPLKAVVTMHVKKSVTLPANSVAYLQQTSLLGEKYVQLGAPPGVDGTGQLAENAVIPEDQTHGFPDLELVFGALSALLNGGGVEQLQTITKELGATLTGRETNTRDLLHQLDTFVGGLDSNKSEIVRALDNLDRFSKILADQKTTIAQALTDIAPGLKILADQEPDLAKMLESLSNLGVVATRVIKETKANTVADFQALVPVLQKLAQAGTYLPRALEVLLDYPFPKNATNGIFGDYTGLLADIDLNSSVANIANLSSMGLPLLPSGSGTGATAPKSSGKKPTLPTVPTLPKLPPLPKLPGLQSQSQSDEATLLRLLMGGLQ
jgi:phospholipid/cholesterol/gamma-HCH transport system substrate-binding protein